jgi:transposase InsO family protein
VLAFLDRRIILLVLRCAECLNVHWFESMEEAKARIEAWRIDYNESRPHQALQEETPAQFAMRAKELERSMSFSTAEN